jgi:PAS domain S-box-containing protein
MTHPETAKVSNDSPLQTVEECEDRYRLMVEAVPCSIQECGIDGVITFANAAHAKMFGCTIEDLIGKGIWDLFESDSERTSVRDYFLLLVREEPPPAPYYHQGRTWDGRLIDVQVDWAYKRDQNGQLIGFVSVLTDVTAQKLSIETAHQEQCIEIQTNALDQLYEELRHEIDERKQVEAVLQDSEKKFRSLFDMSPSSIMVFDPVTRNLVTFNEKTHTDLGYSREEFSHLTIADFDAIVSAEEIDYHFEKTLSEGKDEFATKHRTKDGDIRDVHVVARRLDVDEKTFIQVVWTDTTEQKQAEEALRKSEEKFRMLSESSPVVVTIVQSERFVYCNPMLSTVSGYANDELLGLKYLNIIHDEHRELLADRYRQRLNGETVLSRYEVRIVTKSGEDRWLDSLFELIDYDGSPAVLAICVDISDRRQAESAVWDSHELLESIIESSSDAVFAKDLEGRFSLLNSASASLLGAIASDAIGKTDYDFMPEESADRFAKVDALVLKHKTPITIEEAFDFSGERLTFHTTKSPLENAAGEIVGIVGVARDITERKRAELELQNSQRRTAEAQRIARLGHWDWDLVSGSLYWSDEHIRIFGHNPGEFEASYEAFLSSVHVDDRDLVQTAIIDTIASRTPCNVDYRIVLRDGSVRMVHAEGEVTYNAQGQPTRMIGTAQDITESYQARQTLAANESKFRRVVESVGDAIVIVDKAGRINLINQRGERMFGYTHDELLGQSVETLIPLKYRKRHVRERERYNESPEHRPMGEDTQLWGLRKDGSEFPTEVSLGPIDTPEGLLIVANIRDTSDRKKSEEQRRRHREDLAHITRLSTVGELTTGLAHELNQPLGAMLLYANEGLEALNDPATADLSQLRELFERLSELATQAGEVIRQLRRLVKKDASTFSPVDLAHPIENVLAMMGPLLRKHGVRVEQQRKRDASMAMIDDIQIQQVLMNLIGNAVEAQSDTEPEQRAITIAILDTSDGLIEVAVSDNGTGIPVEARDAIFGTFFTTKSDGIGMGLAISQTIIEAHGGRLWMTPNPDRGTTFHFTLPPFMGGSEVLDELNDDV